MGTVYHALDPSGQPVAVKAIRSDLASDTAFRARFRREITITKQVRGPCTAAVLEADPDGDPPWVATEYVAGPTLRERVATRGPLRGAKLDAFALGMAEALRTIHAAGVVHRDLTANNVILSPTGPKVLDFGIARASDMTAVTSTGIAIGAPSWMAPEQAKGEEPSPAADLFSWAALVTYAATGQPPFGEGRADAVLYRVVHEEPDIGGVPETLRPRVAAALRKDPAARPTADALVHELLGGVPTSAAEQVTRPLTQQVTAVLKEDWDSAETAVLEPRAARVRSRLVAAATGAAVLLLLAAGWTLFGLHDSGDADAEPVEEHPDRQTEPATLADWVAAHDVRGLPAADGEEQLRDAGLRVLVIPRADDAEPGLIVDQDPIDTDVRPGTVVLLYVSRARSPSPTAAPIDEPGDAAALGAQGTATQHSLFNPWSLGSLREDTRISEEHAGHCWTGSQALNQRNDAWRCSTEDSTILDPCLSDAESASLVVACVASPWHQAVVLVHLTEPLSPRGADEPAHVTEFTGLPWAVELANGDTCIFIGGATTSVSGMRLNYLCEDGEVYGGNQGTQETWALYYQPAGNSELNTVPVTRLWR